LIDPRHGRDLIEVLDRGNREGLAVEVGAGLDRRIAPDEYIEPRVMMPLGATSVNGIPRACASISVTKLDCPNCAAPPATAADAAAPLFMP
jgi:hypothetical protein